MAANLTFLPQDIISLAQKHDLAFLVDVDGPPDIHNRTRPFRRQRPSRAATVANIRRLTDAGLKVFLRATVAAFNHHRLLEVSRFHQEIGGVHGGEFPKPEAVQRMLEAVDIDRRPQCQACGFRYLCGGGCLVGLLSIADNPNAPAFVKDYTANRSKRHLEGGQKHAGLPVALASDRPGARPG